MWCPSASLATWANAWLAGQAAPDDVLDALSLWAPSQSVAAYDAVAAHNTGLPWPDVDNPGVVSLFQTLRSTVESSRTRGLINIVLPVPGDIRGLPPGTQFQHDALAAGEAVLVGSALAPGNAVGLVPEFFSDDSVGLEFPADDTDGGDEPESYELAWTVYSLPAPPMLECQPLGDAEYSLRSAVRAAAEALGTMQLGASPSTTENPRDLVEQILESDRHHRAPDHAPTRALRVLENAAHVDAIITVSASLSRTPAMGQSASEMQTASDTLRPLATVVRSARSAAISAILDSAWN